MSDLVKRLRGQKVMDPARGLMCSPTREEEEAADRIEELEGIVRELLSYVESEYIGARGKDYSNGAIGRARAALGE